MVFGDSMINGLKYNAIVVSNISMGSDRLMHRIICCAYIYCTIHDFIPAAGINWEVPWKQVPAEKKAKLFAVVSQA